MEIWQPIPGYERYEASDLGRIRSLGFHGKTGFRAGKVLKFIPHNSGYLVVCLSLAPGNQKTELVHLLVIWAFRGLPPLGHECRHLDGVKYNVALANLVWGTRQQNADDRKRHGTLPTGTRNGKHTKPWATPIMMRRANGTFAGGGG